MNQVNRNKGLASRLHLPRFRKAWLGLGVLSLSMFAACSDDWDEHYSPESAEGVTLWEAISSNSNLSNFARVVDSCGYSRSLDGSQTYTVFALTNDALSSTQADSLIQSYQTQKAAGTRDDDNTVIRQFIQNHIALYRHSASSLTNDTITMMNGKYEQFTSGDIDGNAFTTVNGSCSNGVLYSLNNKIDYFPNVFEYLGLDEDLDSVYNFLSAYSVYEFNESASVPGEIIDGQTTYLDSVVTLKNKLFDTYGKINSEDSTYWMVAPTNSEWSELLSEYENYYVYDNTVERGDSMQWANSRLGIIGGNIFSRTFNTDASLADSAVSTQAISATLRKALSLKPYYIYYQPYATGGAFDGTTPIDCSNGRVLKTSSQNISKYKTFLQEIKMEAETLTNQDSIIDAAQPLTVRQVATDNPFYDKISSNQYVDIIAQNTTTNPNHYPSPDVYFSLNNVLSNVPYDIYVVTAPVLAYDTEATEDELLPSRFRCILNYVNKDGKAQNKRLGTFINDPLVVDTIQVASQFTFPVSVYGLSSSKFNLQVWSSVNRNQTSKYSVDMHIDCIILKPHEE